MTPATSRKVRVKPPPAGDEKPGTVSDRVVSLLDLMTTTLSMAGVVLGMATIAVYPPRAAPRAPVSTVSASSLPGSRRCQRTRLGADSTHWRYGTRGRTWSVRWAALSTIRRVAHDGQTSLPLQLDEIGESWPQAEQ